MSKNAFRMVIYGIVNICLFFEGYNLLRRAKIGPNQYFMQRAQFENAINHNPTVYFMSNTNFYVTN